LENIQESRPGKPVYSPDHKAAALIFYRMEGFEHTDVEVYSSHGLHDHTIFIYPQIKVVKDTDLRWIDNKHLMIQYEPPRHPPYPDWQDYCRNAGDIEVQCIATPVP